MVKRGIRGLVPLLLFLALVPGSTLHAGSIDPAFQAKIDRLDGTGMISAMVMMPEQLDLVTLDNELIRDGADRQERHERVVLALQAKARETQGAVRAYLESAKARGEVESIHPFWVTNAIAVTATKPFIQDLATRADVGIIYEDLVIPLEKLHAIAPSDNGPEPPRLSGIEPGVTSMNADSLWRMGVTGEGVLVCNLDTGVTGSHPALVNKWRGNNGGTAAASWFDPYNQTDFPVDDDGHGTATMGCITGVDPSTGDSIGVAPGAQWIAANVFEGNITTSSAFTQAFEWTIDPDGDPATIDDVPDVISNSWGAAFANCNTQYWNSIDANMTAGAMVVFSAGNEGSGPQSIGSPASRNTSPTNAFAVGATNASNNIASFSSRGPSECDGTTIKPEVVAHGVGVRSANRGGGYSGGNTGTSFSCPYVAGGLALLRQAAPWLTGDEIMTGMMNTAVDLGNPGEDNSYGHGIPDLVAAADALSQLDRSPRITFSGTVVADGGNGVPEAGESFDLKVWLGNLGVAATGVEATLSLVDPDPLVTIDQNSSTFGDIAHDATGHNSSNPYHVTLDATMPGAHVMNFVLDVSADGGTYQVQLPFSLRTPFVITLADHDIGNVRFSVSDGGRFGWDTLDQTNGSGFVFPIDDRDQLFEGALVAGYDSVHVSHSARSTPAGPVATDWQLVPGGEITMTTPGSFGDQDGFSMYSDTGADAPMGVDVVQRSYAWSAPGDDDFVIVELTLINTGIDSSSDITDLYTGLYMDWDIRPFGQLPLNNAAVDTAADVGYMWNTSSDKYCGVHVLTDPGVASFDIIDNQSNPPEHNFTRAEYWQSLSGGIVDQSRSGLDFSFVISTGPFDLAHQDSVTVAFAVLGGDGLHDLLVNVAAARALYGSPVSVGDGGRGGEIGLPKAFGLAQNYPNPFNPSTTIRFQVPAGAGATRVTLEVFDVRGRKVRTLVEGERTPGNYAVQWNGRGDRGEELSSGIYLYRIHAGTFDATRRMLLLK